MKSSGLPAVSVVMPVRNALPYLDAAIDSILEQSFTDFELVIGDDASSDGSEERLQWWVTQDSRIRLSRSESSNGPAGSGNWVIARARCDIVARMDADDVSHPTRLQEQYDALLECPSAVMVGSIWQGIDAEGSHVRDPDFAGLYRFDRFSRPFSHGSVMMRKSALLQVNGYRKACDYWEDTDLFFRLYELGDVLISTRPLYSYRFSANSNRLHAQSSHLERQLALKVECLNAAAQCGEYETVLRDWSHEDRKNAIPVSVFQNRASIEIWSGTRSTMLFNWMIRGSKKRVFANLTNLGFLVAALFTPNLLRAILRLRGKFANRRAQKNAHEAKFVRWG